MTTKKIVKILLLVLLVFAGMWSQSVVAAETEVSGTCNIEESPGYLQCMASDGVTVFDRTLPPASIDCQRWHINDIDNYLTCSCDILESQYYIDECNKERESLQPKYDAYKKDTEGLSSTSQCTLLLSDEYKSCFFGEYNTRDKCIWFQINQPEYAEYCSCDLIENEKTRVACFNVRNEPQTDLAAPVSNPTTIDDASPDVLKCLNDQDPALAGLCLYDLAKAEGNNRAYCDLTEDEVAHYTCDRSISMKRPTIVDMTCQNDVSGPYTRDNCYLEKAQDTEDVRYCPNISNYARSVQCYEKFPVDANHCLDKESNKEQTECIAINAQCNSYPARDEGYNNYRKDRGECFHQEFVKYGLTEQACSVLTVEQGHDYCINTSEGGTRSWESCGTIQDLEVRSDCIIDAVGSDHVWEECKEIDESTVRDKCYLTYANLRHDWLECIQISDGATKDTCLRDNQNYTTDSKSLAQLCQHYSDAGYKNSCQASLGYTQQYEASCVYDQRPSLTNQLACWYGIIKASGVLSVVNILGALLILVLLLSGLHYLVKWLARICGASYKLVAVKLVAGILLVGSGVYQDTYHPCTGWFCIPTFTIIASIITLLYLAGPWLVRVIKRFRGKLVATSFISAKKPLLSFLVLFFSFNVLFLPSSTGGIKEVFRSISLTEIEVIDAVYTPLLTDGKVHGIRLDLTFLVPDRDYYTINLPRFALNSRCMDGNSSEECQVPVELVASAESGMITHENGESVASFRMEQGWFPELNYLELKSGVYKLEKDYLFVWKPQDTWAMPGTYELSIEPSWTVTVGDRQITYTSSVKGYERVPFGRIGTSVMYVVQTPMLNLEFNENNQIPVQSFVDISVERANAHHLPIQSVTECENLYQTLSTEYVRRASGPGACAFWERELLLPSLEGG